MVYGNRKSVSVTHPHLLKEWDFTKNGNLRPEDVTYGSEKKVWWCCVKCDYSWKALVHNRTKKLNPRGCPSCSGNVISDKNRLSIKRPELVKEWDYVKNGKLQPKDVSYGSHKKVWWKCKKKDCGHKWLSAVQDRVYYKTGCPACSNKVVTDKNSLAVMFPTLVKEWHKVKNEGLGPTDVVFGARRRVWWKCSRCENAWRAVIYSRTSEEHKRGCPYCCKGSSISKISQKWLGSLGVPKKYREFTIRDLNIRVDAYVPETNTVYEFLGDFWHGNPKIYNSDDIQPIRKISYGQLYKETTARLKFLEKSGYNVIYIWESDFIRHVKFT
ncbi:MAG TPA: hypothetical protein ENI23_13395 [bacterium]|nr:hypothetical protein [bacterium]